MPMAQPWHNYKTHYRRWRKPTRSTAQMSRKLKPKHIGIPIKRTIQSSQSRRAGAKRARMIHTIDTAVPITMARRLTPSENLCTSGNCTALTPRPASRISRHNFSWLIFRKPTAPFLPPNATNSERVFSASRDTAQDFLTCGEKKQQ